MKNNEIIANAFRWLFIGLLLCFGTSYISTIDPEITSQIYLGMQGMAYIIFIVLELAIAFMLSLFIRKISHTVAIIAYLAYCILTGLSLTGIFILYTSSSLAFVFLITGLLFGVFAMLGKRKILDLTKYGSYLIIALIAIIVVTIINIFLHSTALAMLLSAIIILVFCLYTAYDINRAMDESFLSDTDNKGIYIAFQLFLDFINLFIEILRIFGKRRN